MKDSTGRTTHTTEPAPATDPVPTTDPRKVPATDPFSTTDARKAPAATPTATARTTSADTTARDTTARGPRSGGPGDHDVPPAPRTAPDVPGTTQADGPLVSRDDQDTLSRRMHHAVTDFVENPRRAVEEAEGTFDEIVSGLTEALAERRRVLRAGWREQDTEAQTEELRVALQHYRDISEQLLKI
ncbi:hypothetical protein [Streptomyces sp. NBC_00059]|uniref:hypothetical protein n=1 Tax=Streptomyces sp. NBC_00059 TaxID=2975635 RepID=UPI00224FBBA1|nr:hypothetical protein [Streptomyces sp. NBC_00059]MCX5414727.1 hypothetical protein [Streptomyces sp. NBC_00059]